MKLNKVVAGAIAGVMLGGMALIGCGSSGQHTEYDSVYDTHSHRYVVVTHDYYIHHKSDYSGAPKIVTSPKSSPRSTATSTKQSKITKLVCKIVKKHKKCKKVTS